MSCYQEFDSIRAALAAFHSTPPKCRRHVMVDGHIRDLIVEASYAEMTNVDVAANGKIATVAVSPTLFLTSSGELVRVGAMTIDESDPPQERCPWCNAPKVAP